MGARGEAVERTRRRIIEVAKELHSEQGVLPTSYEEIAERAGVVPATVYRHFPTLADLIPACARSVHVLQPVTDEVAAGVFGRMRRPSQRLEWLIRGTCACYERDGDWLHAARREGDLIPALGEVVRVQEENLRLLVSAALQGTGADERLASVVAALIDFPLWKSLRNAGLSESEAAAQIVDLVRGQLGAANIQ